MKKNAFQILSPPTIWKENNSAARSSYEKACLESMRGWEFTTSLAPSKTPHHNSPTHESSFERPELYSESSSGPKLEKWHLLWISDSFCAVEAKPCVFPLSTCLCMHRTETWETFGGNASWWNEMVLILTLNYKVQCGWIFCENKRTSHSGKKFLGSNRCYLPARLCKNQKAERIVGDSLSSRVAVGRFRGFNYRTFRREEKRKAKYVKIGRLL